MHHPTDRITHTTTFVYTCHEAQAEMRSLCLKYCKVELISVPTKYMCKKVESSFGSLQAL